MRSITTRIVIIECDYILRTRYSEVISGVENYKVINSYSCFENAKACLVADDPDVILMDIALPGINGLHAMPLVKKITPRSQVIMLSVYEFEEHIFHAFKNGASGFITKNAPPSKIIGAIHDVKDGGVSMTPRVASIVIKSFQKNINSPLSPRETQVLEMVSLAKNRKEIAEDLYIDAETVKWHLKNVYTKLNVSSKSEAIKEARKHNLI